MSSTLLSDGGSAILPNAMIAVTAHPADATPLQLSVRGDGHVNASGPRTARVLAAHGRLSIVVSPGAGGTFPPGSAAKVIVSQGRPGSPGERIIELPRMALDGRAEVTVGAIEPAGRELRVTATHVGADAQVTGAGYGVPAALRSALESDGVRVPPQLGMTVVVDQSASMTTPAVPATVTAAAQFAAGVAAVACAGPITVRTAAGDRTVTAAGLPDAVTVALAEPVRRVGGAADPGDGAHELIFTISDGVPGPIAAGTSTAVALVVGTHDGPHPPGRAVPVTLQLAEALAAGSGPEVTAALQPVVAALRALDDAPGAHGRRHTDGAGHGGEW